MKSFPEEIRRIILVLVLIAMLMAQPVQAEGSDELSDFELANGGDQRVGLRMTSSTWHGLVPSWVVFEVYMEAGETLHLGSDSIHTGNGNIYLWLPGNDIYTNTYPTAGIFASATVNCVTQAAGNTNYGLIDTFAKEQAGPLPNLGGYQSCQYTAPASGIYPLMFTARTTTAVVPDLRLGDPTILPQNGWVHAWDATVRNAGGAEQTGRLFTNSYFFNEVAHPDQQFYIYTRDGYQYRTQYDELGGRWYFIFVNNKGVQNMTTGEPTYMSWLETALGGTYNFHKPYDPDTADDVTHKIFINPPNSVVITGANGLGATLGYSATPIGAVPPSNLEFDGTAVGGGNDWAPNPPWAGNAVFTFDSDPSMDGNEYSFVVDANDNGSYDDTSDWHRNGTFNSAGNSILYDGLDGLGTPLAGNNSYTVRIASLAGEVHFPMIDLEDLGGLHIERLNDLSAGNIFQASYDDFNGAALTNASPISLPQGGVSSPFGNGFRQYASDTGNNDVLDTWTYTGINAAASITIDIFMGATRPNPAPAPDILPSTGFPRGLVTALPAQPESKAYTETTLRLSIPSLGVDMPIVGVPQSSNGWDVTWLGNNAGWLNGSAFPTWAGNTIITGHVWDASNNPGPFVNLKKLRYGDQVQIEAWGLTHTYEVRESKLLLPDRVNTVMQHEEYDWLTLVTCEDYQFLWKNYSFRRMVRAVLVDVR